MHLGNGAITTECAWIGLGLSAIGLSAAGRLGKRNSGCSPAQIASLGTLLFTAQMINVPVGSHSSAHLVGGVALAHLLGPSLGMRVMALLIAVQAMFLGDGGVAALGVNIFNMAVLPALLVLAVERWVGKSTSLIALTAGGAILIAALLIPLEVAVGRTSHELQSWQSFFTAMLSFHAFAALLEAGATLALIIGWNTLAEKNVALAPRVAFIIPFLIASSAWAISSALPDGYEAAAGTAMHSLLTGDNSFITQLNGFGEVVSALLATSIFLLLSLGLGCWNHRGEWKFTTQVS